MEQLNDCIDRLDVDRVCIEPAFPRLEGTIGFAARSRDGGRPRQNFPARGRLTLEIGETLENNESFLGAFETVVKSLETTCDVEANLATANIGIERTREVRGCTSIVIEAIRQYGSCFDEKRNLNGFVDLAVNRCRQCLSAAIVATCSVGNLA